MHTLIAFFDDLMWVPRVTAVATTLGIQAEFIGSPAALWEALSQESDLTPEILTALRRTSRGSWPLMEYLTRKQPVLLLFDLGHTAIPWESYLPSVTVAAETRHLPVLCFGPHVQVEKMRQARHLGAAAVVARSRFATNMPALLQRHAVMSSPLRPADCAAPLPAEAEAGIEAFNRQAYFEAHEHLETAWLVDPGPARALYQGILQVGVAYLQIQRGNRRGAVKMFQRARRWLHLLPDVCRGVDVGTLKQDAGRAYRTLLALDSAHLSDFSPTLFAPLRRVS